MLKSTAIQSKSAVTDLPDFIRRRVLLVWARRLVTSVSVWAMMGMDSICKGDRQHLPTNLVAVQLDYEVRLNVRQCYKSHAVYH